MKTRFIAIFSFLMILFLSACVPAPLPTETTQPLETEPLVSSVPDETEAETVETTMPETTPTEPPETEPAEPPHSLLYIPGVSVEDVIVYFNEVCLDSEFIESGDPSFVQKWTVPIRYTLEGDYTDTDIAVLNSFEDWLNSIEGFPGISATENLWERNMQISFCTQEELVRVNGSEFENSDGAVTFWYDNNEIYDAVIFYCTDIDQYVRNSVILEEVYNGLGPIQDTSLRPDSIIYQEYSQPQTLTAIDELILRLLYHPDILPGMDAQQCEQVIRTLYY